MSVRLTAAQAVVAFLASQFVERDAGEPVRFFAGVWAIFGHGNVAALGEALHARRDILPTFRAHNEQAMGHAAIAFAKASRRRRCMVCTTSIGPGATNLATAAAAAHISRLPVLFLPGDVFASRRPDPVLQQVEDFADGTVSANDCLRPLSRYFDRITRPEQLLTALPRAMSVLTDPALCGPVTLALCQDVQAEASDWPAEFLEQRTWRIRRPPPEPHAIAEAARALAAAKAPLIIAGGGVIYAGAGAALADFAARTGAPVAETQAGKGSLVFDHPANLGALGVTGTAAANAAAAAADLVIGIGTRLTDFSTGSGGLFANPGARLVQINVSALDAVKHGSASVVGDAALALEALDKAMGDWRAPAPWREACAGWRRHWEDVTDRAFAPPASSVTPSDAEVIGAVWRAAPADAIIVAASGGLPGELHKLWRVRADGGYHLEYGYSTMGYEIAGGLGVKLAEPAREVIVMVGDGAYLMLNSEIATSVAMGLKFTIVVVDNRGFGCIERLQRSVGAAAFNNRLQTNATPIDFAAHAASLGALAEKVADIGALGDALARAFASPRTSVVVIETDPDRATADGGAWWDVAVPEVSDRQEVRTARAAYEIALARRES